MHRDSSANSVARVVLRYSVLGISIKMLLESEREVYCIRLELMRMRLIKNSVFLITTLAVLGVLERSEIKIFSCVESS
jgi:hypothetical protein